MRAFVRIVHVVAVAVFVPTIAFAQATITGTVKDTSGAILPGVTVEASSPVLIEKVRTVVTDGSGQYRIVDLRPGTYSVTFTLPGFNTFKRDGVELEGALTATINADLRVGALEETVTVTGESPIIDVQSVRRQTVISGDVMKDLPAARSYAGVMMLIPSTITQAGANLDIQVTPGMLVFGGAGGRNNEARIQVDGLNTGAAFNGAGVSSYMVDISNAQEIATTTSGGLGEAEVGGPSFSIVPKTGGNQVRGSFYQSNVTKGMVGDNYTAELQAAGLTTPGKLFKLWDSNLGVGGPIAKDRVWFFFQFRDQGSHRTIPGMFANRNMGDPTKWNYEADRSRPAVAAGSWRNGSLRLTAQPTAKHKFNVFWDQQRPCQGAGVLGSDEGCRQSGDNEIICGAAGASNPPCSATAAPENGTYLSGFGQRVQQATWTSPMTNKLLLEAGFGTYWSQWGGTPHPGSNFTQLIGMTEQCTAGCATNGSIANLNYRSGTYRQNFQGTIGWRGSASYVTGAHNMKFGYQGGHLIDNQFVYTNEQFLTFRVNNMVPNLITETINQTPLKQRVRYAAFYGQESWTVGRMTFQGAVRYDRAWSYFPEVTIGPVRFLPTAIHYDKTPGVTGYNDITPRAGLAWDLFGTGKTSVKLNFGKYLQAAQNGLSYGALRPSGRLTTTVTRAWTDADQDFVPDCDLLNPFAQSPAATGSIDTCAQISDLGFGTERFTSGLDDKLISGWGVRPGDWQIGASIQQELLPRVSAEFGYTRRWLTNFTWDNNVLQAINQFDTFSITAPNDSRLPEEARGRTIGGLYNVQQSVASQVNNITMLASDAGGDYTQVHNGFLLNLTARMRNGLTLQGGIATGVTEVDYCDVRAVSPEFTVLGQQSPTNPWCNTSTGWSTRATGLGSYTIPKVDVLVSGTFRSDKGSPLAANMVFTSGQTTLGRAFANNAPNVTVNLVEPGTLYGDRVNEIDMRFAKILRFGRTRTNVGFDIYNILNSHPILTYNQAFNPTINTANPSANWLAPQSTLQPRFVKFSAQIDF
jgi:hypothetical protein